MAPKRDPPVKFNRPSGGLSSNNPLEQTSLGDGGISSTRSALAADANGSPEVEMQNFTHETFKEFLSKKSYKCYCITYLLTHLLEINRR